jgi:hypothetical protein
LPILCANLFSIITAVLAPFLSANRLPYHPSDCIPNKPADRISQLPAVIDPDTATFRSSVRCTDEYSIFLPFCAANINPNWSANCCPFWLSLGIADIPAYR